MRDRAGRPRKYSDQDLIRLAKDGMSKEDIASRLGCTPSSVWGHAKRLGISLIPTKKRERYNASLLRLFRECRGKRSVGDLARMFKTSEPNLAHRLKAAIELYWMNGHAKSRIPRPKSPTQVRIFNARQAAPTASQDQIARKVGARIKTVQKYLGKR